MKRLACLIAALLALAGPAFAAIVVNNGGATIAAGANNGGNVTSFILPTTVATSANTVNLLALGWKSGVSAVAVSDPEGNCSGAYTLTTATGGTGGPMRLATCYSTTAKAAPCTVTASVSPSTQLNITAAGTCGNGTQLNGMSVSGTSITAGTTLNGACVISGGTGTCTIAGNAGTPTSETVTISSNFKITWTTATTFAAGAINISGLANPPVLDKTGTTVSGTGVTSLSVTGVTLSVANEILIGENISNGTYSAWLANGSWTSLGATAAASANVNVNWAYQIVAATTGVAFAPSWTTSTNASANFWTFEQAGSGAVTPKGQLLGVGP